MKTLKMTVTAVFITSLVALPVTNVHAWGGWSPWGGNNWCPLGGNGPGDFNMRFGGGGHDSGYGRGFGYPVYSYGGYPGYGYGGGYAPYGYAPFASLAPAVPAAR